MKPLCDDDVDECRGACMFAEGGGAGWEVWYGGGEPERMHALLCSRTQFTHQHTVRTPPGTLSRHNNTSATIIHFTMNP